MFAYTPHCSPFSTIYATALNEDVELLQATEPAVSAGAEEAVYAAAPVVSYVDEEVEPDDFELFEETLFSLFEFCEADEFL